MIENHQIKVPGCQSAQAAKPAAGGRRFGRYNIYGDMGGEGGVGGPPPQNAGRGLLEVKASMIWAQQQRIAENKLGMMRDIVDFLAKLPGEKAILLASPGFMAGSLQGRLDEIAARALRAGVVINALIPRGLYAGPPVGALPNALVTRLNYYGNRLVQGYAGVLYALTGSTGGELFRDSNDLKHGFQRLALPPEVSYRLAFAPAGSNDGRFHDLKVRLTKENDYTVDARRSYYEPSRREVARLNAPRKIDTAVMANNTAADLPVSVTTLSDETLRGELAVWAVVHVNIAGLKFKRQDDRNVQELRIGAALFDGNDRFVTGKEGTIGFALTGEPLAALSREGINAMFMLLAPAGKYRLRAVVEDPAKGAMTAMNLPVELR